MKRLLTTALLLTFTVLSFAQVRTKTEEVTIYGATDYYGTMKYNYVVDDEGNHIMHGNVSINGKTDQMVEEIRSQYVGDGSSFMLGDYRYTSQYHRAVDSFSLTAQFNNGIINGPITISHKSSYIGEDKNYSLKGSFKDGKPEGVFSLSLNDQEGKHSYTVSFHDGILISTNYYNDVFKGTVSNDRIISGIWDSGDGLEEEYVNGVLVRESKPGKDTPPKLEELARRYAYNEISVGDLLENGYYVTYNTFDYGSDIWHIIIGNEYFANWTDLLGIDLEKPDTDIIYRSLDIPKYASDNELEKIAQGYPGIIEYLKPYYEEQDVPLYVVKYNEYYPSEYSTRFVERFISVQQKARLDSLIEEKQMLDKAVDFMDYLVSKGIINDNDFDVIRRARSIFTKEAQRTTINRFYEQYKSLVQKIDNNPEISLLNWETDNSGRVYTVGNDFIKVSSVNEYLEAVALIEDYMARLIAEDERIAEEERLRVEQEQQKYFDFINDAFAYLGNFKKTKDIVNSEGFSQYFNQRIWSKSDWKNKLSNYIPVSSYLIESVQLQDKNWAYAIVWVTTNKGVEYHIRIDVSNQLIENITRLE